MCFWKKDIPLSVQFEAACAASSVNDYQKVNKILRNYGYPVWTWNHHKHLKKYLSFTSSELLEHFKQNQNLCRWLIVECGDKRYTPNTLIKGENDKYLVGRFDFDTVPKFENVLSFDTIEEAVTDYVLYSLEMPRLK